MAHSIAMLFAARIVDGLSGGNISTARAYVADVTEPKDRARAYGLIGAAFGLGFIFGPALSGILAKISYTAPIWAAAAITVVATAMAPGCGCPRPCIARRRALGNPFGYLPARCCDASGLAPDPHHRLRLLVRVRHVPDDVRAVRGAALRLRRAERPATSSRRSASWARSCRADSSGRSCGGSATSRRSCSVSVFGAVGLVARGRWRTRSRCSRCRWCRSRSASASGTRRCRAS